MQKYQCKFVDCKTVLSEKAYEVSPFCFVHHPIVIRFIAYPYDNRKHPLYKKYNKELRKHEVKYKAYYGMKFKLEKTGPKQEVGV